MPNTTPVIDSPDRVNYVHNKAKQLAGIHVLQACLLYTSALVASALKIKPVMGSTDDGNICQLDQARGMNRALIKLVEQVIEKTPDSAEKVLAISHCNCPARAQVLKEAFEERMKLAKIVVLDTCLLYTSRCV